VTEIERIEQLRQRFGIAGKQRGVVIGIGDDCAIFRPSGSSEDLVFTTDQVVEGVHFRLGASAQRIGHRALARALSDIAAMAADPRFCLISLAVPRRFDVDRFYRGIQMVARKYRVVVAGGDMARAHAVTCDVVVCGSVRRGQALLRSGARPGETVYVSGPLGRAAASGYSGVPEPRIAFARKLRQRASACMDLSDGLSIDLYRLCVASGVGASVQNIPIASGATEAQALHGGEDYELLYTGPAGLPGIPIGSVTDGPPGCVALHRHLLAPEGYDHFA
jgi:thiamine-monophosphate kinase